VALDRAGAGDRARLQKLVEQWEPSHLSRVLELLSRYDALAASRAAIHRFLDCARRCLDGLPASESQAALKGLTVFLAKQTDALGV
jgi:geranylgeranyl pyrophosphate synthase